MKKKNMYEITVKNLLNYVFFKQANITELTITDKQKEFLQWVVDTKDVSIWRQLRIRKFISQQLINYRPEDIHLYKINFEKFLLLPPKRCRGVERIKLTHASGYEEEVKRWKETFKTPEHKKDEARKKVSEGVRRYYDRLTPEQRKGKWKNQKEYWMIHGHTEEEAIKLAAPYEEKRKRNQKEAIASEEYLTRLQSFNIRKIQYWLNKGYTEEEAKRQISELQRTFTIDKCIARYGFIDGLATWSNRQHNWLKTLNSKSDEEKLDINIRRCSPFKGNASKHSLKFFFTSY